MSGGPILVIGAAGKLGSALMRELGDLAPVAIGHDDLDIEDTDAVAAAFARYRPSVAINAAAFHAMDACETDVDKAFAVNAFAVDRLGANATATGARLVHISTDYVFSGASTRPYTEHDATEPVSVYGASKVAGETLLRRHGPQHVVVRTSGLYGARGASAKGESLAERVLRQARAGERLRVVDDVTTTPSNTAHVAAGIRAILESGRGGTFHVTNAGSCTWHTFATEVLRQAGVDVSVEPVPSSTFPTLAKRPAYSVLAHDAMRAAGLPAMPPWQDGITAYLAASASGARLAEGLSA